VTTFQANIGGGLTLRTYAFLGGPLQDLTGTPTITITNLTTSAIVLGPTAVGVQHPSTGVYTYFWNAPVSGADYLVVWDGFNGVDPEQANEIVTIVSGSTGTSEPCSWALGTGCCDDWDTYSAELQAQATRYATLVLWSATGRQYGACDLVVRPCGRFCTNCPTGYYWDSGVWLPYIYNGLWYNCWCGFGAGCQNCDPNCRVYLPGPVLSVTEVRLGGAVLTPGTDYFISNNSWLIRVDTEECWPLHTDQNLAPGDADAFEVSYVRGKTVPGALLDAAKTLACEYARACLGAECALPNRVTSIARQGTTVTMVDVNTLLEHGLTGIKSVDDVIRALNPNGLKGATRFYSPDVPQPNRVTWP